MSISCSGDFRDFFGGWVGGLRNGGMCDVTYMVYHSLNSCICSYLYDIQFLASLKIYDF